MMIIAASLILALGIAFRVRNAVLAAFVLGIIVGMSAHARIYW
jgi:hypothetical protein